MRSPPHAGSEGELSEGVSQTFGRLQRNHLLDPQGPLKSTLTSKRSEKEGRCELVREKRTLENALSE